MELRPDVQGPPHNELRLRAAVRVARKRAFFVSAAILGSLIVLNLYFYSQSHRSAWLLLDAVFAGILVLRAWHAFGSDRQDERKIRQEMDRMRRSERYQPNGHRGSSKPTFRA